MTIDANLMLGVQIGWVLGMVTACLTAFVGWHCQRAAKRWKALQKRGGYAGVQQE